jgi:rhodanese-related sulfurtransferase
VEADDAIRRHAAGAVIVDVRDRFEWESGHVPAARHVPLAELVARARELPRDTPVLVYCQTGSRSAIAASVLRGLGIDARDAGGITAWRRSGGPVETVAPAA